jgi:hypothetical protein
MRLKPHDLCRSTAPSIPYSQSYTFLTTLPLLRHRAQILSVTVEPSNSVLIFKRLGRHTRRVWFFAWLTLLPVMGCFPQISHIRDIETFLVLVINRFQKQNFRTLLLYQKVKKK